MTSASQNSEAHAYAARVRPGAADMSAVGVGDGEGGAVEGRVPAGFVHDVVVVVAEEHEVRDDGGSVGERDDVVD